MSGAKPLESLLIFYDNLVLLLETIGLGFQVTAYHNPY